MLFYITQSAPIKPNHLKCKLNNNKLNQKPHLAHALAAVKQAIPLNTATHHELQDLMKKPLPQQREPGQ